MYCYKMFPKRITKINEMFEIYFTKIKHYTLRVEYSLQEYQNRTIEWNLKRLRRYLFISFRSCFVIFYLWTMMFWSDCSIPGIHYLFSKVPVDSSKLLFVFYSILIFLLELMSLDMICSLKSYKFDMNLALKALIEYDHSEDEFLSPKTLDSIFKKYLKLSLFSEILYHSVHLFLLGIYLFIIGDSILNFLSKKINFIEIFFVIIFNHPLYKESVFVAGQLCFDLLGFAYTGHFFLRKFKNFVQVFRENQQSIINRNLVLKKYCREYLKQSFEIALMNRTARDCFFIIEMVSKVTIVFAMLFFEDQSKINIYSLTVMLVIVFFFLINATLLARVSSFESLNLSYYRSMLTWQNRNRFRSFVQKSRFHYDLGSINEIRRNFFTQTISTNPIGFDCGRIFHVTKLKYIELQFMNCVLLLLFYKRFLLWNHLWPLASLDVLHSIADRTLRIEFFDPREYQKRFQSVVLVLNENIFNSRLFSKQLNLTSKISYSIEND